MATSWSWSTSAAASNPMPLLPLSVVQAAIEEQLPSVRAWIERQAYEFEFDDQSLELRVRMTASNGEEYLLRGELLDFPTLPPIWRFLDPRDGSEIGRASYPATPEPYPYGSPLIIDAGKDGAVICAHFSRLAYGEVGGPHGDWGAIANWQSPAPNQYVFAVALADQLSRIALDVRISNGRRAPLP